MPAITHKDQLEKDQEHWFCRLGDDGFEPCKDWWLDIPQQRQRLAAGNMFFRQDECQNRCDDLNSDYLTQYVP